MRHIFGCLRINSRISRNRVRINMLELQGHPAPSSGLWDLRGPGKFVISGCQPPPPPPCTKKNSHRIFTFCMGPILGSSGGSDPWSGHPRPATPLSQRGSEGYPSVIKIRCEVCSEFRTRLKNVRNFSTAFIDGIAGAALKRDSVNNSAYVCFANQFLMIANQFRISIRARMLIILKILFSSLLPRRVAFQSVYSDPAAVSLVTLFNTAETILHT